jgi:hypothetical protein
MSMHDAAPPLFEPETGDIPVPKGPWSFLAEALPGGSSPWGLQLLLGWFCFQTLPGFLWALHLRAAAGSSALPAYWGELITVRDIWEMAENGGLRQAWTGPWVPLAAAASLVWFLWAGWQVQARAGKVEGRLVPWLLGFLDALLIAAIPLGLLATFALGCLSILASTGIQGLGWLNLVGGLLVRLAAVSTFFLQAWICRLGRAQGLAKGGFLGHLRDSFLRLWTHPVQWFALVTGGVVLRTGLAFLLLLLGWRMGGATAPRVWALLGWQSLGVLANAWLMGWFLRVTALFWRNETAVAQVLRDLEASR